MLECCRTTTKQSLIGKAAADESGIKVTSDCQRKQNIMHMSSVAGCGDCSCSCSWHSCQCQQPRHCDGVPSAIETSVPGGSNTAQSQCCLGMHGMNAPQRLFPNKLLKQQNQRQYVNVTEGCTRGSYCAASSSMCWLR